MLLQAWVAWDAQPGAIATAHAMADACGTAARELGYSHMRLRDLLIGARRHGLSRPEAIDQAGPTILEAQRAGNGGVHDPAS